MMKITHTTHPRVMRILAGDRRKVAAVSADSMWLRMNADRMERLLNRCDDDAIDRMAGGSWDLAQRRGVEPLVALAEMLGDDDFEYEVVTVTVGEVREFLVKFDQELPLYFADVSRDETLHLVGAHRGHLFDKVDRKYVIVRMVK